MGRRILITIFTSLLFSVYFQGLNAQFKPAPVEKSTQKILFKGKVYFIHKVKPNQTIHSISRAYGVTYQDIAVANPNITLEVIKPGQSIKIPAVSTLDSFSESYYGLKESDFHFHVVEPQQTITYLKSKYNVPAELIYKYNPGSEEIIQIGQVLKIPKSHIVNQQAPAQPIEQDSSKIYVVKAGDTLYSLSKRFGVNVADFIAENPDLRWGLKLGMILTIPGQSAFTIADSPEIDSGFEPGFNGIELFSEWQCDSLNRINYTNEVKVVIMLPFHVQETLALDTIMNDSVRKAHPFNRQKAIGRNFLQFYQGFLLAMDSIKATGKKATVFTYDTRFDTNETDNILKELEIIRPDMIVGPIKSENIKRVSNFSKENKIPLILPLAKANIKLTGNNPYAVTLMPDLTTEIDLVTNYLSQFSNKNIIVIHNQDTARMDNLNLFRKSFFAHLSSNEEYEHALYKELRTNDTLNRNLTHTMREDIENIIVIVSNNEAYVSNIVGLLAIQDPIYKIRIVGLPSWQKFRNLRIDQLHALNTTLYTPYFIDYSKKSTKRFIELCRNKLGSEPFRTVSNGSGYNFNYLGYETGLLFPKLYLSYGKGFINCLCNVNEELPQRQYNFIFNTWGGFRSNSVNIITYSDDYNLYSTSFIGGETRKKDTEIVFPEVEPGLKNNIDY